LVIQNIFEKLTPDLPPIIVVQHMPENYTKSFAKRLNEISKIHVKEAEDGDILKTNFAYIAKGGKHISLDIIENQTNTNNSNSINYPKFKIKLSDFDKFNFIKPSIDIAFISASQVLKQNVFAILLTGMGKDGAEGLKIIKENGGYTIIQDKETSIVWGMPGHAYKIEAYNEILPIDNIAKRILELVRN